MGILEDKQQELADIKSQIKKIYDGAQEYSISSRRLRRPELKILYDRQTKLENDIASIQGQNITVSYFDRR